MDVEEVELCALTCVDYRPYTMRLGRYINEAKLDGAWELELRLVQLGIVESQACGTINERVTIDSG